MRLLKHEHEPSLVHPVRDHSAVQGKEQYRQRPQGRDQPTAKAELVSWSTSHPWAMVCIQVPHKRDELPGEEEPEVSVAQCGEDGAEG